jgi:hypothetical protein
MKLLAAHFDRAEKQHEKRAGGEPQARLDSGPVGAGTSYVGEVRFEPDLAAAGLKAALIYEKLAKLGHVSCCDPPAEALDDLDRLETFRFHVTSGEPVQRIIQQVRVSGVREANVKPLDAEAPAPPCGDDAPKPARQGPPADQAVGESPARPDAPPEPEAKQDEPAPTARKSPSEGASGMGMDIVKSKIEGLNGVVDIETVPGRGTTMTIKLPVTLAILPSLMVDIAGDVFAMPMEAVTEIVSVGHDRLNTVQGRTRVPHPRYPGLDRNGLSKGLPCILLA